MAQFDKTNRTYTINSRKIGRPVTFSVPGSSYVYVDLNGQPGTLGYQICDGGSLSGWTIAVDDIADLPTVARHWWRQYLGN